MEAKYISCSTAVSEAIWIKQFVDNLKLSIPNRPVDVFCDNKSAISLIKSGANSSKSKHIETNNHYIQDIVERGEIQIRFIPSSEMVANPMTKGLTLDKFKVHVGNMRLVNPKTKMIYYMYLHRWMDWGRLENMAMQLLL